MQDAPEVISPPPGRRELNKADKRRRIEHAAKTLFSERGYSMVTTQEVARLAEVGTGTLFRYANSKGELLCMVANDEYRSRAVRGEDLGTVESICELTTPFVSALRRQPENALAYHRETLFGEPGPHRDEALAILSEIRDSIAEILGRAVDRDPADSEVRAGARTVFDVLYMEIVRAGAYPKPGRDLVADLRSHVSRVINGVLPSLLPV